jgi:hypothetical protein
MSEYESDGVEETMQGSVRMAVTVAARGAAEIAMMRAQHARQTQADGEHAAREFAQQREALWQDSRAELAPVLEERWWQEATPERIGQAYATAQAWDGHPEVEPYLARIREQVKERYGVDIDEVRDQTLADRLGDPIGSEERERADADKDRAEAARLMEDSDRADRAQSEGDDPSNPVEADHAQQAQADAELMYDSAERREALAEGLRGRGVDAPVVEARVAADIHQAVPAAAAVAARPGRAPKARRNRSVRGQQRNDRGR